MPRQTKVNAAHRRATAADEMRNNFYPRGSNICTRRGCLELGVRARGHRWLCAKHHRFQQMRHKALDRGLIAPTENQLEEMLHRIDNMTCPYCERVMNWFFSEGGSTVLTLQHHPNGHMELCCGACNTRLFYNIDSFPKLATGTRSELNSLACKRWYQKNKAYRASYMRAYRAKQKRRPR